GENPRLRQNKRRTGFGILVSEKLGRTILFSKLREADRQRPVDRRRRVGCGQTPASRTLSRLHGNGNGHRGGQIMIGQVQPPKEQKDPVAPPGSLTFNTVITKLKAGQQIFSNTITDPDLEAAKEACIGQDFMWIEMQHSTLTWREAQQLIKVIAEAGSIPFLRVPSANVGDILKACDAGALGIRDPVVQPGERP